MSRLALYFLGAPRLELDGEVISLSHHKAVALLAYLGVTSRCTPLWVNRVVNPRTPFPPNTG